VVVEAVLTITLALLAALAEVLHIPMQGALAFGIRVQMAAMVMEAHHNVAVAVVALEEQVFLQLQVAAVLAEQVSIQVLLVLLWLMQVVAVAVTTLGRYQLAQAVQEAADRVYSIQMELLVQQTLEAGVAVLVVLVEAQVVVRVALEW
jgi:hypothetical protein